MAQGYEVPPGNLRAVTFDYRGKRALVTGASSGIGAGLAEELARRGATVGICARREDRLTEVLERCRAHAPDSRSWVTDLADPAQVDALAARAIDELGGVDILVNNAGIPKRRHVTALDPTTVEHVMHVNYLSPTRLTLALLPQMVEQGDGLVLNISSVAATLSAPGEAAYDASKAALTAFSEAMAVDLWETGVRVFVVYPGIVDTELFSIPDNDPSQAPVDPITVDELVAEVFAGIDAGRSQVYVPGYFEEIAAGKAANVDGYLAGTAEFVRDGYQVPDLPG
jgi:short-subunit dehydrogenase